MDIGDVFYIIPMVMFGVMTSNIHMAWMRVYCGRHISDNSYSSAVYNNFPWPAPTHAQKTKIEQTAQAILDARSMYPDCSLAECPRSCTKPTSRRIWPWCRRMASASRPPPRPPALRSWRRCTRKWLKNNKNTTFPLLKWADDVFLSYPQSLNYMVLGIALTFFSCIFFTMRTIHAS